MLDFLKERQPKTGFKQEEDRFRWQEVQKFLETYLNRDVTNEIASKTLLEVLEKQQQDLEAASKYIAENEVIHKKTKKNVPNVIEYQGRRYVLDHANHN